MQSRDTDTVNQILAVLRFNQLPDPETIFDRRDTALYIQQLVYKIQEFESSIEEIVIAQESAEEAKEEAERELETAEERHILEFKKLTNIKTNKEGEDDVGNSEKEKK